MKWKSVVTIDDDSLLSEFVYLINEKKGWSHGRIKPIVCTEQPTRKGNRKKRAAASEKNARKKWKHLDRLELVRMYMAGASVQEMARRFDRSDKGIEKQIICMAYPDSRKGVILQPDHSRYLPEGPVNLRWQK